MEMVEGDPMEAQVSEPHPEEGRSNPDCIGQYGDCGSDSESDSHSKWKSRVRSLFWYELEGLQEFPDYRSLAYPWEETGEEEEEEEEHQGLFLEVTDTTWSSASEMQRERGRWEEHPGMARVESSTAPASSEPEQAAEHPGSESTIASSSEVLEVRMEMHRCYEEGLSYRRLFRSEANREELKWDNADDEPYFIYICRQQRESRIPLSYAHVFPDLNTRDPLISCTWVTPTTMEGDKEYIEFFPKLMQVTVFGESEDNVLAKAIVLARKSFRKILRFQIDIAVHDCIELMKIEEATKQRYDLYYFVVSEIVLNNLDFKSVLKTIRDGHSGLQYNLTEFVPYQINIWEDHIEYIVDYIVSNLREQRERGMHKEWVFEEVDWQVAQIVCETVDAQVPSSCNLYVNLLHKKRRIAQKLGLLSHEDINSECH